MSLSYWPIALLAADAGARPRLARGRALRRRGRRASWRSGAIRSPISGCGCSLAYVIVVLARCAGCGAIAIRRSLAPLALGATAGAVVVAVPITLTVLLSESSNRADDRCRGRRPGLAPPGAAADGLHPEPLRRRRAIPRLLGPAEPALGCRSISSSPATWACSTSARCRSSRIVAGVVRGVLVGARDPILHASRSRADAALRARALHAVLSGCCSSSLPGVDLFRRPGDATFLVGALGAIVAGYLDPALVERRAGRRPRRARRAIEIGILGARFRGSAWPLPSAKGTLALRRQPLASAAPLARCAPISSSRSIRLGSPARRRSRARPCSASSRSISPATTARTSRPRCRPRSSTFCGRTAAARLIAALKEHLARATALDRVELTGLGFHWPNASLVHRLHNVLGYNPVRLGALQRRDRRRGSRRAARAAQVLAALSFLPLHASPTSSACASSPPACRSSASIRSSGRATSRLVGAIRRTASSTRTRAPCRAPMLRIACASRRFRCDAAHRRVARCRSENRGAARPSCRVLGWAPTTSARSSDRRHGCPRRSSGQARGRA